MRYGTTISLAGLLLVAAVGCGKVENGVCPAEQDDMVACTIDLCDFDAKSWVHIPDDALCTAGQRCDPTMGCVAAGGLTGHAYLFAHSDHSGITVTVDGIEGGTTMTDKDGNWSFTGLPTGTFNLTYSKDKYIAQKQTGVSVFPAAASSPDAVTLTHGTDLSPDQIIGMPPFGVQDDYNNVRLSPDKKHAVVRYSTYYGETVYRSYSLDSQSAAANPLYIDDYPYGPYRETWLTNTHFIWNDNQRTIWARAYDGSPAVILATQQPKDTSWDIEGTPNDHVILRRQRDNGTFNETSLFVVKVDGSTTLGTPAWVQADTNHPLGMVVNNDTTAMIGVDDSTASPPTDGPASNSLKRIDLATSAVTTVATGFASNYTRMQSLSPDGKYLLGYLQQSTNGSNVGWVRGFMIAMDGTSAPSLAPNYGAAAAGAYQYSDYTSVAPQWFKDSSGVVYQSYYYVNGSGFEGGLRLWLVSGATSSELIAYNTYFGWGVHNKNVTFRDSGASTSKLLAISASGTHPPQQPVEAQTSAAAITTINYNDDDPASTYVVWTVQPSGTTIKSAVLPSPLTGPPAVTTMGGTIPSSCSYEAYLVNTTYWQLCQDTFVLQGFTKSSATAGTQTQGVRGGMIPVPDADRIAFRKLDNKLYASPGTGTLSDVKLVSALTDYNTLIRVASKWLVFTDVDQAYMRASNADGSSIDEPLTKCTTASQSFAPSHRGDIVWDAMKTHFLLFETKCPTGQYGEYEVPAVNLP